ncbi:MAG: adenylosuccinate lyase [Chlorobi bacterium]|nr:MAG: adenylosuccinate lyase [Chlorobi bacterium OLB7]MBK8912550.1 adenylosuccinate lyase [Chlorobiota bacterium]MCE7934267.1 adenylosuccinate lyase [Chlorobi bacterium CHB2]
MIERYTRPQMGAIWQDQNKYTIWLEIETLAVEAQAEMGIIPTEAAQAIRERGAFDVARVLEIEETTKHDVIAFLTNVAEYVGEPSRYVHLGMTSSDVLDTCLAVQLKQAGEIILADLEALRDVLARRAKEFKYTMTIGRSHGIHAEPTTFGLKLALWHQETVRNIERMKRAIEVIAYGQISGAVGTFEHLSPQVEEYVCQRLGLKADPVTTQVIQRDRHAEYMATLGVIAATLEQFATEIRHLQRTEVLEAEEYFSAGQKGSSAMPHKRNPIISERICGMARIIRANALAAMENVALWHERDISHSSVERVICPDSTIALDYILDKMTSMMDRLLVYPETMMKNLEITSGLHFSQTILLELAKRGISREDAYRMVQRNAMEVWQTREPFAQVLKRDAELTALLPPEEIDSLCDLQKSIRNVDHIFQRCGLGE